MKASLFALFILGSAMVQAKSLNTIVTCQSQDTSPIYTVAIVEGGKNSEDMIITSQVGERMPKVLMREEIGDYTKRAGATDYFTYSNSARLTVIRGKKLIGKLDVDFRAAREMFEDPSDTKMICTVNSTIQL